MQTRKELTNLTLYANSQRIRILMMSVKRQESDYRPLRHENSDTQDDFHYMESDDDDDDISTASSSEHTQSSEAGESETGSGSEVENANDPWQPLIEEAKQRNVSEYEEMKKNFIEKNKGASSQAYALILPKLQRHLESIYLERLF